MASNLARQPSITAFIGGMQVQGIISASVQANAYHAANRFAIECAWQNGSTPWGNTPPIVEIQATVEEQTVSLVTGQADSVDLDPQRGRFRLHGRDLTCRLVDAQTNESFENQTASNIATTLATRHGLTPVVTGATEVMGRYYQGGRTRSVFLQHSRMTSEWDVLIAAAEQSGVDVWVDGYMLYFRAQSPQPSSFVISPNDCLTMSFQRSLQLAAGVSVRIDSWDTQTQTLAQTSASTGSGGLSIAGIRPNLAHADAQQLAQKAYSDWASHANEISFEIPGDLGIAPRLTVNVVDTNSDFDGDYTIVEVESRFSMQSGFTQSVIGRMPSWMPSSTS